MKSAIFPVLALMALGSCTSSTPEAQQPKPPPHRTAPSSEKEAEAVAFVRDDLPFPVEIDPFGAIWDSPLSTSELVNLKSKFLLPLATSPWVSKIGKVSIDASALEWSQWTCKIEFKEAIEPISITHFAGLYDGSSSSDPDAYRTSRPYVLSELDKMAKQIGWR